MRPGGSDGSASGGSTGGTWRRDLAGARVLGGAEMRATWRRLVGNRRRLAGAAIGLVQFVVVLPLVGLFVVPRVGRSIAGGSPPLGTLGAVAAGLAAFGLLIGAASSITQNRTGRVGPLVRTSIPPNAVVVGRFGAEMLQMGVLYGLPGAILLVEIGIGAGGPLVPLLLGFVYGTLFVASVFVGRTAGATLRLAGALSGLSTWGAAVAFLLFAGIAYVLGLSLFDRLLGGESFGPSVTIPVLLPGAPLQAAMGTVLAPVGGTATATGILAVAVVLGAVPAGLVGAARLERRLLLSASAASTTSDADQTRPAPGPFAARQSTRMAWRRLLRAARNPKSLSHLLAFPFMLLGGAIPAVEDPAYLFDVGPPAAVVVGALLTGEAFCLNPMGDDRRQLPLILTSSPSTAVMLRGRVIAGAVPGLLPAVGLAVPLALANGRPLVAVGLAVLAPVLAASSAGIALGLGALFPSFERRGSVTAETAQPSQRVLLGHQFGGGLLLVAGPLLLWLLVDGRFARPLVAAAGLVYLLVLGALGALGYGYAVRRFDGLPLDDVDV